MRAEEHMTLQDAADTLGISEKTARRWVKSGKLKADKPGLKYLIPASAVRELLGEVEQKVAELQEGHQESTERMRFVAFLANLESRLEKATEALPHSPGWPPVREELVYLSGMVQGARELLELLEETS